MTKFGDYVSSTEWGPKESFILINPNLGLVASQQYVFTVGSYVMPFPGRLVAELQARVFWTVDQTWYRSWLSASTPAPTTTSQHAKWAGFPGGFGYYAEQPITAIWDSLAAGTTVTVNATIGMGSLGGGTVQFIGGLVRASPT